MSNLPKKISNIQRDWEDREFVEIVQLNVLKITAYLNQFDQTVRFKLAVLNEKIAKLERVLDYCENLTNHSSGNNFEKAKIEQK